MVYDSGEGGGPVGVGLGGGGLQFLQPARCGFPTFGRQTSVLYCARVPSDVAMR